MQAIEFKAVPQHHSILISEGIPVADCLPLRILLLINTIEVEGAVTPLTTESKEVFQLLAGTH